MSTNGKEEMKMLMIVAIPSSPSNCRKFPSKKYVHEYVMRHHMNLMSVHSPRKQKWYKARWIREWTKIGKIWKDTGIQRKRNFGTGMMKPARQEKQKWYKTRRISEWTKIEKDGKDTGIQRKRHWIAPINHLERQEGGGNDRMGGWGKGLAFHGMRDNDRPETGDKAATTQWKDRSCCSFPISRLLY
ncbi:hypothetical protein CEXT_517411 [Caerostris extrusa]|uniref:Uncharacterized protein n=1 Tax=Caerostris extrusa TaxID=172846 RepID=A0AAV4W5C0_CAEEX|nr:hypothetical protein CEXT_517411 [Caerostris extrusa]